MAFLIVGKILDSVPGVKKDGNSYNIAEEVDATLFVALGQEVMQLPRVAKVEDRQRRRSPGHAQGRAVLFSA